jgi:hypothetical protein
MVGPGNFANCLKPWAIPDKWIELRPVPSSWSAGDVFNRYVETGPGRGTLLSPADNYIPPTAGGMRPATEFGLQHTVAFANPEANDPITTGFLLPVSLPGGNPYHLNISSCSGWHNVIGEHLPTESDVLADTVAEILVLIDADSGASWDSATSSVRDSCAPGPCGTISPRLVAMMLYDVERYQFGRATDDWSPCPGRCVRVTNIIGFFIESVNSSGAVGYITKYPGRLNDEGPDLSDSSFLPAIALLR